MSVLKPHLEKIAAGESLDRSGASEALQCIIAEEATGTEIGALLLGLRMKGETVDEIAGFVDTMEQLMNGVDLKDGEAMDVCGTGGDQSNSFNVSTTVALVTAAAGVTVAKHGNRSVSSRCGSADVLESLGVAIDLGPEQTKRCADEIGICFFFAPLYHPAMKAVVPHRKNLGLRTIFNMLGPLLNPARVNRQLIGTFDLDTAKKLAGVLHTRGCRKACTVHSADGFDELSPFADNHVIEVGGDLTSPRQTTYTNPVKSTSSSNEVIGEDPETNAALLRSVLSGEKNLNREMVTLNAGYALYVADKATTPEEGRALAGDTIDSGAALKKLDAFIEMSQNV